MRHLSFALALTCYASTAYAGLQFDAGGDLRDVYREANSRSTVGYVPGCGEDGNDKEVLFIDGTDCGTDPGFLYSKTPDHGSIGPDAGVDQTLTFNSNFPLGVGGRTSQGFLFRDVRTDFDATDLGGLVSDLTINPALNTEGITSSNYSSILGSLNLSGTSTDAFNASSVASIAAVADINLSGNSDVVTSGTVAVLYSGIDFDMTGTGPSVSGQSMDSILAESRYTMTGATASFGGSVRGLDIDSQSDFTEFLNSSYYGVESDIIVNSTATGRSITNSTVFAYESDLTSRATHTNSTIAGSDLSLTVAGVLDDSSIFGQRITISNTATDTDTTEIMGIFVDVTSAAASTTHNEIHGIDIDRIDLNTSNSATLVTNAFLEGTRVIDGTTATFANLDITAPVDAGSGSITNAYAIRLQTPTAAGTENAGLYFSDGTSNLIWFEGATANGFETSVSVTEPTADNIATFPDATGTVALCGATNPCAGVWSPTTNNIANLDSSSAGEGQYMRVGNTVTGSVLLTVDPTAAATSTQLELDLPVASNFGATSDAAGACGGDDLVSEVAGIRADATSNEIEVLWVTTSLASHEISCSFSYQVI